MSKKPDSATVINAWAPAKINLGLRVLGKRPDGYHDLLSLMVPVSLYDKLRFDRGSQGIELSCPQSDLPTGEENLVYRATRLLLSVCQRAEGIRIELIKKIPVGAGLGGGSSDAATTLVAVNELLGRPLQQRDLHALGVKLGADVPFFLLGTWAMAEGIGDTLTPLNSVPKFWTVLVHPKFQVSTRWAYENLTLTTRPNGSKFYTLENISERERAALRERLLDGQVFTLEGMLPLLANDFEPLIFSHYPQLYDIREALLATGARAAPMTGSGPTLVGLFESEKAARSATDQLARSDKVNSFLTHTLDTTNWVVGTSGQ